MKHVIHFFSFCSFQRDARLFESTLYYNFSRRNLRYIYEEQKELAFRNSWWTLNQASITPTIWRYYNEICLCVTYVINDLSGQPIYMDLFFSMIFRYCISFSYCKLFAICFSYELYFNQPCFWKPIQFKSKCTKRSDYQFI